MMQTTVLLVTTALLCALLSGCQQDRVPSEASCDGEPEIVTLLDLPIYGDVIKVGENRYYGGVLDIVMSMEEPTSEQIASLERQLDGFRCGRTTRDAEDLYLCLNRCATTAEELREALDRASASELVREAHPFSELGMSSQ